MSKKSFHLLSLIAFIPFAPAWSQLELKTNYFRLVINDRGCLSGMLDPAHHRDHISVVAGKQSNPLLVLYTGEMVYYPSSMQSDQDQGLITLYYGSDAIHAKLRIVAHPSHISFELLSIEGINPIAVQWGPFACDITQIAGETIGVVRDEEYAIGIQALNMHTMGGILNEYHRSADIGNDLFREPDFNRTATIIGRRSELRAYTRDKEGGIKNSKIGLFGCPSSMVLELLGKIELAENLPHPLYDGIWGKVAPVMKENWMVTDFSEANIDEIIDFARRANLTCIHTMSPFETWGHFQLNKKKFPNGLDGLKSCVEKAARYDITLGIHCLSNFITTNDPYVTPVPDQRLACDIKTGLVLNLDSVASTIFIEDTSDFGDYASKRGNWTQGRKNHLKTVRIENELITYGSVAHDKPYRLVDCNRGAYGTIPAPHKTGAEIGKLWDHDYKVFFPSFEMQKEMAVRLAEIINYTGLKEISFDGLEGCFFSGYGMYAAVQFVKDCIEHLDHQIFCDASIINHNLWHYFSRMTWGDENYETATRVGDLKFKNQAFYSRNFIPPMMGAGLKLTTRTRNRLASTTDDAEWQLSKNAGFDAGFGIDASLHTIKNLGNLDDIIRTCNAWEEARALNAFTPDQKERLANPAGEWHLEKIADRNWLLSPVEFHEFTYQATLSDRESWIFVNKFDEQDLQFTIQVTGKSFEDQVSISDPIISLNEEKMIFSVTMKQNQYLVYQGGKGNLFDENWHLIKAVDLQLINIPSVYQGEQTLVFSAGHDREAHVTIRIRTCGKKETVKVEQPSINN